MKKVKGGCFAAAAFLALVLVILISVGTMRQQRLRDRPPLTAEELDRLAEDLRLPPESAPDRRSGPVSPAQPSAKRESAQNLPRRLERIPTAEARREFFTQGCEAWDMMMLALVAETPLLNCFDAALAIGGVSTGASWERGCVCAARGNYEEARESFADYLRHSDDPVKKQQVCAYMAWLQDDPEMAARYMELACSDSQPVCLVICYNLALESGSEELRRHYRALLDRAMPERQKP